MEKEIKCKICGTVFLTSIAVSLVSTNIFACELCQKKIEDNPHSNEFNYIIDASQNTPANNSVLMSISGTPSIVSPNPNINRFVRLTINKIENNK